MTTDETLNEKRLKERLLNLAKNIEKYFPNVGISQATMNRIKDDIMERFSPQVVMGMGLYLGQLMQTEGEKCLTLEDVEALEVLANEHVELLGTEGDQEILNRAKHAKSIIGLESKRGRLVRSAGEMAMEASAISVDAALLDDMDLMKRICSGYIEMANGKKPEEIPGLAADLGPAQRALKIFDLHIRAKKLNEEVAAISSEAGPINNLTTLDMLIFEKEIVSLKLSRLPKNPGNFEDVAERKKNENLLGMMRRSIKLKKLEMEWNSLATDIGTFFGSISASDPSSMGLRHKIVNGIFNAQ